MACSVEGIVFGISILSLGYAAWLAREVLQADTGSDAMREIAAAIKEGAEAFLKRQYRTIAIFSVVLAVIIYLFYALSSSPNIRDLGPGIATKVAAAFIIGATCSAVSGCVGMFVSIRANLRTAAAATSSLDRALRIALRGGAVSGLTVVAMSLLGVGGLFYLYGGMQRPEQVPLEIVGFGFGASFVALFAQLGGGIYTKAADVGADLVGKVEAGIPEDDPRNPAVIADLVGDNVGDCAGRGADIFESSSAEFIGAMVLGVALFKAAGGDAGSNDVAWIFLPLVLGAFGLICSLVGVWSVRPSANPGDPMAVMNKGFYVTAGLSVVALFGVCAWMLDEGWWKFALCGCIGIATSFAFVYITQYYTSGSYRPVREIAEQSRRGYATNIISGLSVGMETTGMPALVIGAAILSSYYLGKSVDFPTAIGFSGGIFGTAVATLGMLMSAAYILAMDCFGPITDNA